MRGSNYWQNWHRRRIARRSFLGAGGAAIAGAGAFALVGCGDDDDGGGTTPTSEPTQSGGGETPTEGAGGGGGGLESGVGDRIAVQADTFFGSTNQVRGGTINWNTQYAAATVRPTHALAGDHNITDQLYQPLYSAIESGAIILHACDSVEEVDELTWTVHLRDNLKFHPLEPVNGRAVTPEDVKFSWENATGDATSYWGRQNGWIDTIEALPDNIVRFTSKVPNSGRIGEGGQLHIMAQEAIEAFGEDINKKAIGTGPWMLPGEFAPDRVTEFLPHPEFMISGRPFPERLTFRVITDQQAHISAYASGQIDYMSRDLPKALAEANGGDDEITRLPFIAPEMLGFNHSLAPIDNPDVRRAISLAIDRKDLIERLGFGEGQANGPIPFGLPVWALPQGEIDEFYAIDSYDANLAEARALIEAAGGDALPELNIINQNDIAIAADMGPLIAGMLESAGLKVQLMPAATLEWITNLYGGDAWHLSINQWGNALDPMFYLSQYTGPDVQVLSNNRSFGGGSAEIDSAVNALLAEFDPQARVEKVLEAQRAILESYSSVLNLFDPYAYYLRKPYLKDFRAGDNEATYLQWDYWIDQG